MRSFGIVLAGNHTPLVVPGRQARKSGKLFKCSSAYSDTSFEVTRGIKWDSFLDKPLYASML